MVPIPDNQSDVEANMLKITHFTSRVHITDISWYQTNKFMFAGKGPNPKQSHINTMRVGTKYWP